MKISRIELFKLNIPLKVPFIVSKNKFTIKTAIIIKIYSSDGIIGWGESPQLETPWYISETIKSGWNMLKDIYIPRLLDLKIEKPKDIIDEFSWIQGNQLCLAAIDAAIMDIFAQRSNLPLWKYINGEREEIEAGASIGIHETPEALLETSFAKQEEGYKRLKIKIKPGKDIEYIKYLKKHLNYIPIMIDANSAYTLNDIDLFKKLDQFNLMMIEQPLENRDFVHHSILQKNIETPVCLDESIHSIYDAETAAALKSCKIINIKPPRVGGIQNTIKMQTYLEENNIPVWCGGMLETGIGRMFNMACASLSNFSLPGDMRPPLDFLEMDIVDNNFNMTKDGTFKLPDNPGIGITINKKALEKYTVDKKIFSAY